MVKTATLLAGLDQQVHIWRTTARRDPHLLQQAWKHISVSEQSRADGIISTSDREMFVLRRATLRAVLAHYLECAPSDVRLEQNVCGPPTISATHCDHNIKMNVSHASGTVLIAINMTDAIGVDVEYRDDVNASVAADRVQPEFSAFVTQLQQSSPESRDLGATGHWTGIEALVKAARLRLADDDALQRFTHNASNEYWLRWLPLESGLVGALAGRGSSPKKIQLLPETDSDYLFNTFS